MKINIYICIMFTATVLMCSCNKRDNDCNPYWNPTHAIDESEKLFTNNSVEGFKNVVFYGFFDQRIGFSCNITMVEFVDICENSLGLDDQNNVETKKSHTVRIPVASKDKKTWIPVIISGDIKTYSFQKDYDYYIEAIYEEDKSIAYFYITYI